MTGPAGYAALVDAEADAEGTVRIAEVKLTEVRRSLAAAAAKADPDSGEEPQLSSVALITAEEGLAKAVRRLQRCRDATVAAAAVPEPPPPEEEYSDRIVPDRTPQYTNAADWIEQYLVRMWRRQNVQWCAKWFLHGEAISRLEALWRSWEFMRYEGPTAMAIWWRDYADYHLRELTAKTGPFEFCNHRTGEHQLLQTLTIEPAPDELRRTDDTTDPLGTPSG